MSVELQCLRDYTYVLANPFDGVPSCVPMLPALHSRKLKVFARGIMHTQTADGFGFVLANPNNMAGDVTSVHYTRPTDTYTTLSNLALSSSTNSPYTTGDFTSNAVSGRLVACGLRIRYIGTTFNQSGSARAIEHPDHQNLHGFSWAGLGSFDKVQSAPVTREWIVCTWQPITPKEFHYTTSAAVQDTATNHDSLAIAVQCDSTIGHSPFEWEYFQVFEAIGMSVRGKTPSHIHPDTPQVIARLSQQPTSWFDQVANSASTGMNKAFEQGSYMFTGMALSQIGASFSNYNQRRQAYLTL